MFNAEIAKCRYLPLPRWTALAVMAGAVIAGAAMIVFQPKDASNYANIPAAVVDISVIIAGIVFGVWIAALEFSANTMQRTLTAEPDRNRVLFSKLVVLVVAALVVAAAAAATAGGLAHLGVIRAGGKENAGDIAQAMFAVLPDALAAALIGFGFGLLGRSMGGGVTLALAFRFVLSGILSLVPGLKKVSFDQASADLTTALSGQHGATTHNGGTALLIVAVWLIVIILPAWFMFLRADLK